MDSFLHNSLSENQGQNTQANDVDVLDSSIEEKTIVINRNKPWRVVIRRIVSDGGSDYEDVYGKYSGN